NSAFVRASVAKRFRDSRCASACSQTTMTIDPRETKARIGMAICSKRPRLRGGDMNTENDNIRTEREGARILFWADGYGSFPIRYCGYFLSCPRDNLCPSSGEFWIASIPPAPRVT